MDYYGTSCKKQKGSVKERNGNELSSLEGVCVDISHGIPHVDYGSTL